MGRWASKKGLPEEDGKASVGCRAGAGSVPQPCGGADVSQALGPAIVPDNRRGWSKCPCLSPVVLGPVSTARPLIRAGEGSLRMVRQPACGLTRPFTTARHQTHTLQRVCKGNMVSTGLVFMTRSSIGHVLEGRAPWD